MNEETGLGFWVRGLMEADDIPPKEVAAKSGVHESTLSRFFNGIKPVSGQQKIKIGMAIGEARLERALKRATA